MAINPMALKQIIITIGKNAPLIVDAASRLYQAASSRKRDSKAAGKEATLRDSSVKTLIFRVSGRSCRIM